MTHENFLDEIEEPKVYSVGFDVRHEEEVPNKAHVSREEVAVFWVHLEVGVLAQSSTWKQTTHVEVDDELAKARYCYVGHVNTRIE